MNAAAPASDLTDTIAGHLAASGLKHPDKDAIHAARRSLFDTLAVSHAASGLAPECAPFAATFSGDAPSGPCRVPGQSGGFAPSSAALANGALAHALDFGDTFDRGAAHPHAALIPALRALCEVRPQISVASLLAAIAAGADLACRLSLAPQQAFEEGGWYAPALVNGPAAAGAAALVLGLDADRIAEAIGLSLLGATFPGGFRRDAASPLRGTREAFAARAAVEAALLAESGARAFADPLGAKGGFFDLYAGGFAWEPMLEDLGERWLGSEVSFKPWPCCRGTHAYIEAALALRARTDLEEISRIEVPVGPLQRFLADPLPAKRAELTASRAKFSISYTLSAALVDGHVDLATFAPAKLADARLHRLAALIVPLPAPGWTREDAARGEVTIITKAGDRYHHSVSQALGCPDNPLSDAMLHEKFVACLAVAADPLPEERARAMAAKIWHLPLDASASCFFADAPS